MSDINTAEIQHEILGDLSSLYYEYVGVLESVPLDAPDVQVPYRPQVAADHFSAAKQKLTTAATGEDFAAAVEAAAHTSVTAKDRALLDGHFVGTITGFFDEIVKIDEVAADVDKLTELKQNAAVYQQIPGDRQKGAKVGREGGYYWAGQFVSFVSEEPPKQELPSAYDAAATAGRTLEEELEG